MIEPDEAQLVRRHLTGIRRTVLRIVIADGPIPAERIADAWSAALPGISDRHRASLPRMVVHVVWRLENLGWVRHGRDGYEATDAGRIAVTQGSTAAN